MNEYYLPNQEVMLNEITVINAGLRKMAIAGDWEAIRAVERSKQEYVCGQDNGIYHYVIDWMQAEGKERN